MPNIKEFETALVKQLVAGRIDKASLKNASSLLVSMKKEGLVIDHINIKGQPKPDRIIINGIVDPEFWMKFNKFGPHFRKFDVFPPGIINPEAHRFRASINMP